LLIKAASGPVENQFNKDILSTAQTVKSDRLLERTSEAVATGYPPHALDAWAKRARAWANGGVPDDLSTIPGPSPTQMKRNVFMYMISGAKVRAPTAATALIERLK
jgi:hypothetical protein